MADKNSRPGQESRSLALKRYHSSRTPEQRAQWLERVRVGTSLGMYLFHDRRTPEQREATRQRVIDSVVCGIWMRRHPGHRWQKGHQTMGNTPEAIALRTLAQVQRASVRRIMKEVVATRPDLVRDAIIDGLLAPAPRSYPYLALAAAYLDGKPTAADPPTDTREDLSELTRDQLLARALAVASRLQRDAHVHASADASALLVIDVVPESNGEGPARSKTPTPPSEILTEGQSG